MSGETSPTRKSGRFEEFRGDDLADRLDLPHVVTFESIGSTLDVAHAMAEEGAAAGTLVLADAQTAGRGRQGRSWASEPGAGIWLTLIERPRDVAALDVLSLRIGLALAPVLDRFASSPVHLKWPNDLYLDERKLAGILVEARWREGAPEWVAIGVGVNVRAPASEARAVGLRDGVSRVELLEAIVPALRAAARRQGPLDESERMEFAARDMARGRECSDPVAGVVEGIDAGGSLLVRVGADVVPVRAGSLVLQDLT